jgi:Zn-dependent membrane protease YugP
MFSPYLFNSNYLLYILPAFLLTLLVQFYVNSAYKRWSQVPTTSRMTGADTAQRLIRSNGLYQVQIQGINGQLTDRYDPSKKILYLSQDVASSQSVASVAVAAHELGHAMQDQEGYFPLKVRAALVPAVNIGSTLGWILILVGLFINFTGLAWLGVLFFALGSVFALATLPVELNASARARQMLTTSGIVVNENEARGVRNVLNAAALTYVAALASSILQLFYYISLVGGMSSRRRD